MSRDRGTYLSAREAAAELGISLRTLYAYVSRGLIHSQPSPKGRRTRRYLRQDVEEFRARRDRRRDPSKAVAAALHWGEPVLESSMTLIDQGHLYYRGHDATELARSRGLEEVAELLWRGALPEGSSTLFADLTLHPPDFYFRVLAQAPQRLHPVEALQVLLALAASEDLASYDLRPDRVVACGARILGLMALLAADFRVHESGSERPEALRTPGPQGSQGVASSPPTGEGFAAPTRGTPFPGVATVLQRAWLPDDPGARRLLDAAMVLCADHELNVSSFTARCVASANSTPYGVVVAGLAALRGTRHGGHSERVEALLAEFDEQARDSSIRQRLAARLRRGERLPGFGHPIYSHGDPRCRALLDLAEEAFPGSPSLALVRRVEAAVDGLIGEPPTIDFGLAGLARILGLPQGTALTLFALGRTVGWLGHALEQYSQGRLIRPRARYTGPLPEPGA